jgi:guanylate kinase
MIERRGLMFVLSSPSGAGKTTLARRLLAAEPDLEMSVSVTTRPMRRGEVDGRDYYFLSKSEFNLMAEAGELLEHAQVFGNFYGTPRGPVATALEKGGDVLFDIDWQGTQQLEQSAHDDLVRVFILPPSLAELERRLRDRAQDSGEVVDGRMARAWDEISHWAEYDYVIVNDDLEKCLAKLRAILAAERLRRTRQKGLAKFVNGLRG